MSKPNLLELLLSDPTLTLAEAERFMKSIASDPAKSSECANAEKKTEKVDEDKSSHKTYR